MAISQSSQAPRVAYFCMEYGLDSSFPIYAGGLGILAGDHMKSVGDLHAPVTGIGLFWGQGYTRQLIDKKGAIEDHYPATPRDALRRVELPKSARLAVTIKGKTVPLRAWKVDRFITSTLYLLEPERPADGWITQRLYGGGEEERLAQEIVLGVGGVRLLQALGHEVDVYHFNEGHAVFAGLELLRQGVFGGKKLADRMTKLRPHVVFTTHTPVPAGNEVHDHALMRKLDADCGFSASELEQIGGSPFSMTVAGLRLARIANGVAELHGETARAMWKDVAGAAPIIAITNGVHTPTWQDARVRAALVPDKPRAEQDDELWAAHQTMKQRARRRGRRGAPASRSRSTSSLIGFARRAASYKRADLILGDAKALKALFARGVQIVYSGKAHPARRRRQGAGLDPRCRGEGPSEARHLPRELRHAARRDADPRRRHLAQQPAPATRGLGHERHEGGDERRAEPVDPRRLVARGLRARGHRLEDRRCRSGRRRVRREGRGRDDRRARPRACSIACSTARCCPPTPIAPRWLAIMRASIAMSQWRFSSDRMIEDYLAKVYRAPAAMGSRRTAAGR